VVVPDAIDPVVGWRSWRVRDGGDGFVLVSASRDAPWPPGATLAAACEAGHPAPCGACTCGIYAAREPGPAVEYLAPHVKAAERIVTPEILGYDAVLAVGLVALWGSVIVCEWGWRAQYAYPRELFVPAAVKHYRRRRRLVEIFDSEAIAAALADAYCVGATVTRSLRSAALAELAPAP
jgi:hypothetical protein